MGVVFLYIFFFFLRNCRETTLAVIADGIAFGYPRNTFILTGLTKLLTAAFTSNILDDGLSLSISIVWMHTFWNYKHITVLGHIAKSKIYLKN